MLKKLKKNIYISYIRITRRDCKFDEGVEFGRSCFFEGRNYISKGTYLNHVFLGFGSYTGKGCFIEGTDVGKYTCIGPNVTTAIGRHPTNTFVSQHPAFFSVTSPIGFSYVKETIFEEIKYAEKYKDNKKYAIVIGNDVWIGANVIISDGVTIGDGAIIAAGSIVTSDVIPYTIVGGVPAKFIKYRFENEKVRAQLEKSRWWDLRENELESISYLFNDVDSYIKNIMN